MSYYTGTAATMTALRTAITNALVMEGWTWDSGVEIIHKGTMFFKLTVGTVSTANHPFIEVEGRTALIDGDLPPNTSLIREFDQVSFLYPITYHIFSFAYEVWVVVNIGDARYMHMAFGQSQIMGFPGTGNYFSALVPKGPNTGVSTANAAPLPFSQTSFVSYLNRRAYYIHTGINLAQPWLPSHSSTENTTEINGWLPIINMLDRQPNVYNQEAVLLPIRIFHRYLDSKNGLVMQLDNARYLRNDFIEDEEIIELGPDRWMVFPGYTKNTESRNVNTTLSTQYISGTYAVALRYDGP